MRIFDGLQPRSSDITDADMSVTAVGSPMEVAAHRRIALHTPLLVLRHPSRMSDGRTCESTVFPIRQERFDLVVRSEWKRSSSVGGPSPWRSPNSTDAGFRGRWLSNPRLRHVGQRHIFRSDIHRKNNHLVHASAGTKVTHPDAGATPAMSTLSEKSAK